MKITFLAPNYPPSVGGAQLLVQRVAEGLVSRHGHQVEVLTSDALASPGAKDRGCVPERDEIAGGVRIRRFPVAGRAHSAVRNTRLVKGKLGLPRAAQSKFVAGPISGRLMLAALVAGRQSDVVVGLAAPFLTLQAARMATFGTSAAHISLPLPHLAVHPPESWIVKTVASADGVCCLTTFERDWFVERGVPAERVSVIPPGCDPELYKAVSAQDARRQLGLPERPTVGYIGRLAANKGVDTLLAAAESLWRLNPSTTLLLVGRPMGWSGFDELVTRVRQIGGDRLILRAGFDESERSEIFAACDVIAFPSRQESFGMVTIEAWCARRPIVAGDIDVVRCIVRPGIDGELVDPENPESLARTLSDLLSEPDRMDRYGRAGRARAESEFRWEEVADKWHDLVTWAAENRRSAGRSPARAGGRRA